MSRRYVRGVGQRSQMGPQHLIKSGTASGVQVIEKQQEKGRLIRMHACTKTGLHIAMLCIVSYRRYVQEADPSYPILASRLLFFLPSAAPAPLHQVKHKKNSGRRANWRPRGRISRSGGSEVMYVCSVCVCRFCFALLCSKCPPRTLLEIL